MQFLGSAIAPDDVADGAQEWHRQVLILLEIAILGGCAFFLRSTARLFSWLCCFSGPLLL